VNFMTHPLHKRKNNTPVDTEEETCWVPQPVWTFWRTEKYTAPARIRAPDWPTRSLVAILTEPLDRKKTDVMMAENRQNVNQITTPCTTNLISLLTITCREWIQE
jgi:hypothetical protein